MEDQDLREKQRFCFGYEEFELSVRCPLDDISPIQNVKLELLRFGRAFTLGESVTRASR